MKWEDLTSTDFKKAVKETKVCILSLGVIEKHGEHLPLGTDMINAYRISCMAAEKESAVVFPQFYFGQINEARCFPGTIAIGPKVLFDLLYEVVEEIGRNGFQKIIFYNGHGGNADFLRYFNQCTLSEEKSYYLYGYRPKWDIYKDIMEEEINHSGEWETSVVLGHAEELVKMERIPEKRVESLKRMESIPNTNTGICFYSEYPEHYCGDAKLASVEKGKIILQRESDELAKYIANVKADDVVPSLNKEFFERSRKIIE